MEAIVPLKKLRSSVDAEISDDNNDKSARRKNY